jgi:hypothetical protein
LSRTGRKEPFHLTKVPTTSPLAPAGRAGIDADDRRRRQEESAVRIRKEKKGEQLAKRRGIASAGSAGAGDGEDAASGAAGDLALAMAGAAAPGAAFGQPGAEAPRRAPALDTLPMLTHQLKNGSEAEQLEATTQFRRLLSVGAYATRLNPCTHSLHLVFSA